MFVGEAVFHVFINTPTLNVRSIKLDFNVCKNIWRFKWKFYSFSN